MFGFTFSVSLLITIFLIPCEFAFHTNEFAVKISGSADEANSVAAKYGFTNKGQIGSLEGYYLFEKHDVSKRSLEPSSYHTSVLLNDSSVHWCEQQVIKTRVKRSSNIFTFSDPLYSEQWFLHADKGGYDMNVRPAWERGYTGKGVVVSILDDGIQGSHPDLALNYDKEASYDLNDNDEDPSPKDDDDNKHGTRCAGEIAAVANNEFCGVGIAYNAKIGGVRMLDGSVTDTIEASALSLKPNHIHIYSASWGPEDDGKTVDGPGTLAKFAFEEGIKKGRNGLGSIYVWASGNGGKRSDNCNCDGYTNSIYTISISSATESGYQPWYLEECSSTLATTYSSGTTASDRNIVTVDVNYSYLNLKSQQANPNTSGLCTLRHTGTSASAPIAAGMCALSLEANPYLTWRDMQYIIIMTSRNIPLIKESGWITNGAGRKVSCKFGYGLMDGDAMVNLASKWKPMAPQHVCSTQPNTDRRIVPRKKGESVEAITHTEGCLNSNNVVRYAEHVQVTVTLEFHPRGNLRIDLVSPKNTTSTLLFPRPYDTLNNQDTFVEWPFMSVHFWGEEIFGIWRLIITNKGRYKTEKSGVLTNWTITFYGTEDLPDCVKYENCINNKKLETMPHAEHTSIRDISESNDLPAGKCKDKHKLEIGPTSCASKCAIGFYSNIKDGKCYACDKSCYSCYGPSYNNCLTCPSSSFLLNSTCVKHCPDEYYESFASDSLSRNMTNQCIPCAASCLTCRNSRNNCIYCKEGFYLLQNKCVYVCPDGYHAIDNRCSECSAKCKKCFGPSSSQCLECSDEFILLDNRCVADCPEKHFLDEERRCVSCHSSCEECDNQSECFSCAERKIMKNNALCELECRSTTDVRNSCFTCEIDSCEICLDSQNCDKCQEGYKVYGGSCYYICPSSTYIHLNECKKCLGKCFSCSDNPYRCTTCQDGFYLHKFSCVSSCPSGSYGSKQGICQSCHSSCLDCYGPFPNQCITCLPNYYLMNSTCVASCDKKFYATKNENIHECIPCHPTCEKCNGYGPFFCTECSPDRLLIDNTCVPCPDGSYLKDKICKKCHDKCGTCYGPLSNQCTSCIAPLRLQEQFHTCLPCCDGDSSNECCKCSNNLDVCIVHDNINGVNIGISMPQGDSNPQDSYSKQIVTIAVVVSAVVIVMFVVLFCILQYRSYGSWRAGFEGKKYMPVPRDSNAKFNSDQEKVCLTEVDGEEEDDIFLKT